MIPLEYDEIDLLCLLVIWALPAIAARAVHYSWSEVLGKLLILKAFRLVMSPGSLYLGGGLYKADKGAEAAVVFVSLVTGSYFMLRRSEVQEDADQGTAVAPVRKFMEGLLGLVLMGLASLGEAYSILRGIAAARADSSMALWYVVSFFAFLYLSVFALKLLRRAGWR